MRRNSTIDAIFKNDLREMDLPGKEMMWERMEQQLDAREPKRKKRLALLLLCLFLVLGGLAGLFTITGNPSTGKRLINNNIPVLKRELVSDNQIFLNDNNIAIAAPTNNRKEKESSQHKKYVKGNYKLTAKYSVAETNVRIDEEQPSQLQGKNIASLDLLPYAVAFKKGNTIKKTVLPLTIVNNKQGTKKTAAKWSFAIQAGTDIFTGKHKMGYYAGLRFTRSLAKGVFGSAGMNYAVSKLSQSYRLSSKPSQQTEADAELNSLTMLQFPFSFEQQFHNTKFSLKAGLTPLYILDASVYNVPNSFNGNPNQYRRFTLDDVNRLNVLFNAGVQYKLLPKLSLEINGSYGLTELVKNSYVNQSNVNGNFKNVQFGMAYRIK